MSSKTKLRISPQISLVRIIYTKQDDGCVCLFNITEEGLGYNRVLGRQGKGDPGKKETRVRFMAKLSFLNIAYIIPGHRAWWM